MLAGGWEAGPGVGKLGGARQGSVPTGPGLLAQQRPLGLTSPCPHCLNLQTCFSFNADCDLSTVLALGPETEDPQGK